MLHWVNVIAGTILVLFLLVYSVIVIFCLLENTGYKLLSIITGLCHGLSPAAFVFCGYQCLHRKAAQYGPLPAAFGITLCLVVYVLAVSSWNRIVLAETPPEWVIALLTAGQVLLTGLFVYGFLYW